MSLAGIVIKESPQQKKEEGFKRAPSRLPFYLKLKK
jgi:hypothetical protein